MRRVPADAVVRIAVMVALLSTVAVVATIVLGGSGSYRLRLEAVNAGQLVKGNIVKVGGVRAGVVESIDLGPRNQALIDVRIDEDRLAPFHEGTRAEIRLSSLSSVAGRYVSLLPGPNDRPALDDGATIRATDVSAPVEVDQLLATLDGEARRALRASLRGSSEIYRGEAADANAGLAALNPALTELAGVARELGKDDAQLERFLVEGAAAADVFARRDADVDAALTAGATTARELADNRRRLQRGLERAPSALRQARRTLDELTDAGRGLRPALEEAAPVAPRVARLLRTLHPLLPDARPALQAAGRLLPLTAATLRDLPALDEAASPAFGRAARALGDSEPLITGARPFVPDVIAGFFGGFGGQTFTYYDANGHYGRIRPMAYAGSTQTAGLLSSLLQTSVAGPAERRHLLRRCPGGATAPAADGSNPFTPGAVPCDPEQSP